MRFKFFNKTWLSMDVMDDKVMTRDEVKPGKEETLGKGLQTDN